MYSICNIKFPGNKTLQCYTWDSKLPLPKDTYPYYFSLSDTLQALQLSPLKLQDVSNIQGAVMQNFTTTDIDVCITDSVINIQQVEVLISLPKAIDGNGFLYWLKSYAIPELQVIRTAGQWKLPKARLFINGKLTENT